MSGFDEKQLHKALRTAIATVREQAASVPLGVSNRHLHLCRADLETLFGAGHQLTHKKDLRQPGQYACAETVTIQGPKGALPKVRVLGPLRAETQIEISVSDGFTLGVTPPLRDSGKLAGSPGLTLVGPKGSVKKDYGVIAAWRHIHLDPDSALLLGLQDKDLVEVALGTARGAILQQVLIRVNAAYLPEMHLDLDEANALGVQNGDTARILLP